MSAVRKTLDLLKEFSLPLITGVVASIVIANIDEELYRSLLYTPIFLDGAPVMFLGHELDFQFIINDIFMVFFFGIAAVEITQSVLPGGSLNPISRAINPLLGTMGGVLGPVAVFFVSCFLFRQPDYVYNGWGIPTATDIALAWLFARLVFGKFHPAVSFLLLLAVADDGIGLVIIAIFYPDPAAPVHLPYLLITLGGMGIALALRLMKVHTFWPYIFVAGTISWLGLLMAHLHPALALVFIVPFMPRDPGKTGQLFEDEEERHGPLEEFEHTFKALVDFGLFGFGLANAGVAFNNVGEATYIVFLSLLVGKTLGIFTFSTVAHYLGMHLPQGMDKRSLFVAGIVAGLGLTVALFVAGQAYAKPEDAALQGAAKMGAIFSAAIGFIGLVVAKLFGIKRINEPGEVK